MIRLHSPPYLYVCLSCTLYRTSPNHQLMSFHSQCSICIHMPSLLQYYSLVWVSKTVAKIMLVLDQKTQANHVYVRIRFVNVGKQVTNYSLPSLLQCYTLVSASKPQPNHVTQPSHVVLKNLFCERTIWNNLSYFSISIISLMGMLQVSAIHFHPIPNGLTLLLINNLFFFS